MANVVYIDDGTREYALKNQFEQEICKVHFRPADFSIIDRYNQVMHDLPALLEPLKNISISADGSAAFEEDWKALKAVETELIGKIASLFGMADAQGIFAERNAFSSIGGEFYCLRVLNALQEVVAQAVAEETELSKNRMEKYLDDGEAVSANAGETAASA